jgi:large subunit ribosomal protein L18
MAKDKATERRLRRARRHARVARKIRGTGSRPRLVVSRSLKHLEGQLVDDTLGRTLLGISTRAPAVRERLEAGSEEEEERPEGSKRAASFVAGRLLAERAREEGVEEVLFDRGGYRYHGRVRAFAEGAREGGLRF